MKIRWISTIILFFTFLIVPCVNYSEGDQSCEPGIVVFFGNGMLSGPSQTSISKMALAERLNARIKGTNLEGKITYEESYNPSIGLMEDFMESVIQITQTTYRQFWKWTLGLDEKPASYIDELREFTSQIDEDIVSANPAVQKHISTYNMYLREGYKVVLVAHSQGNPFGNIAWLGIDPQDRDDRFGIVSVANPGGYVAGDGPYITIDEDKIIGLTPLAKKSNEENWPDGNKPSGWGHSFVNFYLANGSKSEKKILDDIVNSINNFGSPSHSTRAIFVAGGAFTTSSGQYDFGGISSLYLDPASINWIAWNNKRHIATTDPSRPGEFFLGSGIGTDDYIVLNVIAPSGISLSLPIDQNNNGGVSFGPQQIIFGSAADAPDVFRNYPGILDESGSHNAIFTETGSYIFDFSYINVWGPGAHGPNYLLIDCQIP